MINASQIKEHMAVKASDGKTHQTAASFRAARLGRER